MPHVIEPAASSRAKCRSCGRAIDKDTLRFGERSPNAFGDGEMTLWFHLPCAAYQRPAPLLETLNDAAPPDAAALKAAAELGIEHRRLPRVAGAERAPTGRAACRHCREPIARDSWRIALVFFEDYRFVPGGFVHAGCAREYFGTADLDARIAHFSPALDAAALDEIAAAIGLPVAAASAAAAPPGT